ncbi:MAG TPA: 2-oxoglutarate dehydrogenase, E2 component, dihydrolipoamide succinyltransferase [Actinomycetes bacterium]
MAVSVTMPQLGESVTEGTVTRWLKQEGDTVQADEPLLEISTDKVDTEIPAPASGVLERIVAHEDDVVLVGGELAVIGDGSGASAPVAAAAAAAAAAEPAPAPTPSPAPEPVAVFAAVAPAAAAAPVPAAAPAATSGTPVVLPQLGESVTEGTVTRWLKQVGDTVQADEPLLEISTDKVDTEIPAPASGVLLSIAVGEDETVPVGAELGVIGTAGAVPAAAPAPAPAPVPAQAPAPAPEPVAPAPVPAAVAAAAEASEAEGSEPTYLTPLVRKLAAEHGVDLATVTGTGLGGRIRKQDVLAAAEAARAAAASRAAAAAVPAVAPAPTAAAAAPAAAASPLRGRTEKMSRLRRIIAERMVESLHTAAQLTTVVEVDVTRIAALRNRAKADFEHREGVKLTFLPFFAKASVEALKAHPSVNAGIDTAAGTITYHDAEHLGIAVDTERGLLVPVIRDAGDLNIAGLARRIADLAERTRTNAISPDELSGGTFTITNTGSRGALFDTPIINQPQAAILGTGAVVKRPVVVADADGNESIAVRSMAYLALTYDHRLVDGADATRFLTTIKDRLEGGSFEADLSV